MLHDITSTNYVLDDGHLSCHKRSQHFIFINSIVTGHFGKSFLWPSDSYFDHTLQILNPNWTRHCQKKKKERKLSSHGTVFFGKQGIGEGHGLMAMRDLSVILTFNNPWLSIFCCLFILTSGWTHFRGSILCQKVHWTFSMEAENMSSRIY